MSHGPGSEVQESDVVVSPDDGIPHAAVLKQDPHAAREARENNLEIAIGREVRARRAQLVSP
ncbi:hypothetical protein AU467_34990 [Mesorhizobium loti]|uniref:Uncharacterized protein n=1 Tax=Rhizobium loti TaxID=381 RepID=A0A101KWM0_RHILI|nr:hypothetical protein AU467_34990 [Mesorhizobium loti]